MKRLIIATGFILFNLACGKMQAVKTPKKTTSSKVESNKVCYVYNSKNESSCFELTEQKNLTSPADYNYLDPYTDPSFPESFDPDQYVAPINYLDLKAINPDTPLAENFLVKELMQESKGNYGVFSSLAMLNIQAMRTDVDSPLHINSGFRSPGYNSGIPGAARWSRHMYGDAIDFRSDTVPLAQLKDYCIANGASFYQIYQNHIHCDWRNSTLDAAFFPPNLPPASEGLVKVLKSAKENSRFHVETIGNIYYISVESDYIEDNPDQIVYSWEVEYSDKQRGLFNAQVLRLPNNQGPYKIRMTLGSSIQMNLELQ